MKNINKTIKSLDPLAEVKKSKYFKKYAKEADDRIRLAVEIYNTREILGISQQKLAKLAETTQKVISNIENGDVNIGHSLLNRIAESLNFNCKNWSNALGFSLPPVEIKITLESNETENNREHKQKASSLTTPTLFIN